MYIKYREVNSTKTLTLTYVVQILSRKSNLELFNLDANDFVLLY